MERRIEVDNDGITVILPLRRTRIDRFRPLLFRRSAGHHGDLESALTELHEAAAAVGEKIEIEDERVRMSHRTLGSLSRKSADVLGLPPLVDLTLCVDMAGLVGTPEFRIIHGWMRAGRREFVGRQGAILETSGAGSSGLRRLPLWMLDAVEVSSGFNSESASEFHWQALAKFRRALESANRYGTTDGGTKVTMTSYLSNLQMKLADRFAISQKSSDRFNVVPCYSGTDSMTKGEASGAIVELQNCDLREFQRLVSKRGVRPYYNLGRQKYLVVDPSAAPVLQVMAEMQRRGSRARAEFIRDPRRQVSEAISEYLRSCGSLDGLSPSEEASLIDQTVNFALVGSEECLVWTTDSDDVGVKSVALPNARSQKMEEVDAEQQRAESSSDIEANEPNDEKYEHQADVGTTDACSAKPKKDGESKPPPGSMREADGAADMITPEGPASSIDRPDGRAGFDSSDKSTEGTQIRENGVPALVQGAPPGKDDWDESQIQVIEEAPDSRLVVDAGPGTGKTAVACARLAHLIREEDIEPVNTLMISFTRTAVAEIRERLRGYVGVDAFAIRTATLDAHAWAIHSGHAPNAKLTGSSYDENIERTIELLKTDEDVWEELSRLEHVVIDEAQDIVGLRAELLLLLVKRLEKICGITVFADEAQAIYGFSAETDGSLQAEGGGGQPLLDTLRITGGLSFSERTLNKIHRTSSPGLRRIFSDVRRDVLDPKKRQKGQAGQVVEEIRKHADKKGLVWKDDMNVENFDSDTLILFRTRSDVLMASQFCNLPHRLRLSGYGANLPPWLALCFHDFTKLFLEKEEFLKLWSERVGSATGVELDSTEAWRRIRKMAGRDGGHVDMRRLRQRLSRDKPPVELATAEYGLHGPMVGTIHASKGREAPNVVLLLPERTRTAARDIDREAEEARVFFVGATRARETLSVGNSTGAAFQARTLKLGRVYLLNSKGNLMLEVGRQGDISPDGLVGRDIFNDQSSARRAQDMLHEARDDVVCFSLKFEASLHNRYAIVTSDHTGTRIGVVGRAFQRDLWESLERLGLKNCRKPSSRVGYVRSIGCSTLVLASDSEQLMNLHEPWASSGFLLAPRIAAFPSIRLLRR